MGVPLRLTLGLYFMIAGSAGFERYMLQGNFAGAFFDGSRQVLGLILFYYAVSQAYRTLQETKP